MTTAMMGGRDSGCGIEVYVDPTRFPIADLENPARTGFVEWCGAQLAETGCARLDGFIRPTAVKSLVREVEARRSLADHTEQLQSPYFTELDETLAPDHPARHLAAWQNLTLCRDRFCETAGIECLFVNQGLLAFIRDCLGLSELYHYADPMTGYLVNIVEDGQNIPWHFDGNEFSISILLQAPRAGGIFQYVPNLRSVENANYEGVSDILNGSRRGVVDVPSGVGDLTIFKGRNSLHRVSKVEGSRPRYSAIFGYALIPNQTTSADQKIRQFGRCHEMHRQSEQHGA